PSRFDEVNRVVAVAEHGGAPPDGDERTRHRERSRCAEERRHIPSRAPHGKVPATPAWPRPTQGCVRTDDGGDEGGAPDASGEWPSDARTSIVTPAPRPRIPTPKLMLAATPSKWTPSASD